MPCFSWFNSQAIVLLLPRERGTILSNDVKCRTNIIRSFTSSKPMVHYCNHRYTSASTTRGFCRPLPPRGSVGLRQRHLVVQVLTSASPDKTFSLELGVTDSGGTRRRLVLSSSFRTLHCTPLHAQVYNSNCFTHKKLTCAQRPLSMLCVSRERYSCAHSRGAIRITF